jgi:Zn finger protein HypA/HybF involved in hydrogenase expression
MGLHEVEMATRILNALKKISAEHNARVLDVNLRVGMINEPQGVKLWLKKLGEKEFKNTKFNITSVPIEISCPCGYKGKINSTFNTHSPEPELEIACPRCRKHEIKLNSGRELEIVDVKLQELRPHGR